MSSSEHFVWAVDGKPVSVHVAADAVRQIEALLQAEGGERHPEIGGFLLGHARQVNDAWIVRVDAIELASCEHARGQSFTLSRRDRDAFARQMRRLSKQGVVGLFRSHTRPGLYLDQHDMQLFGEFFSHPAAIALAVREDAQAGFFFWEDGEVNRSRPYVTFTCRAEALHFAPQPVKEIPLPAPHRPSPQLRKELLWFPLAAAVALGIFWTPSVPFERPAERTRRVAPVERPVFAPPAEEREDVAELRNASVPAPAAEQVFRKPSAMPAAAERMKSPAPVRRTPKPAPPAQRITAKADIPKPNAIKRAVGSIPGLGFLKKTKESQLDVPPVATRRVAPSRFGDSHPVRVKVKIGKDGYVKSAYLLTSSAKADTIQAVMQAARNWRFTPARQENRPVESELVLTFEPHHNGTD